eukprot:797901_1
MAAGDLSGGSNTSSVLSVSSIQHPICSLHTSAARTLTGPFDQFHKHYIRLQLKTVRRNEGKAINDCKQYRVQWIAKQPIIISSSPPDKMSWVEGTTVKRKLRSVGNI